MEDIIKEIKHEEKIIENSAKKLNLWMIASIVLGIALIIAVSAAFTRGSEISSQKAGEKLLSFINAYIVSDGGATLNSVNESDGLYIVTINYQGKEIPLQITKDGRFTDLGQGLLNIDTFKENMFAADKDASDAQAETPAEVTKSDKPVAEAFVFSYCPYGLQFEKALGPVYELLKDKADINLVHIGAMHDHCKKGGTVDYNLKTKESCESAGGAWNAYESTEAYRQLCIQKEYGKDKLWTYLNKFMVNTDIGACGSNMNCSKPLAEKIIEDLSMDADKINECMANDAEALYDADGARAGSLGISGSPGFVINGAKISVSRTPEAIKQAVCRAFNTAPSACSQNLSASAMTPGFGASAGASTGASCG